MRARRRLSLGLILIALGISGFLLLPSYFRESIESPDGVPGYGVWTNPLWWPLSPLVAFLGLAIVTLELYRLNTKALVLASLVVALFAFLPGILPPPDSVQASPHALVQLKQEFRSQLDASNLFVTAIRITNIYHTAGGEWLGNADFYTFFYAKWASYESGTGFRIWIDPKMLLLLAFISYGSLIVCGLSLASTVASHVEKIRI